ncbi:hypothetical protein G647_03004 [Cladophialophora carrionii CBS 160.54]|uniref:GPI inositol-deacylase winged helix domain-containing protein n=1 Tax=Cladophialophora carrionii CBS 160.54 TaxID=1279043 RepID=V9DJV8_9EURO|nr:uncharacterized protein G647_03004 [Cladophialophora carrionii CBS 160.54]ETI26227.1 hypothetical protein G647_03004 [Cladophialophora carrionii CBS 160.54]
MERIQRQRGDLPRDAVLILAWVVHARRQITVPELQEALAVEIDKSALDEDNIPTVDHITRACAPLIAVDTESNIVRLVHYTTQKYLERTRDIWFQNAQIDITRICITYLSFSAFESGFCISEAKFWDTVETNKLYDYAAQNWGHHAHEPFALSWEALEVVDFLEREGILQACSQALMVPKYQHLRYASQMVPRQMTALHLAGYFGLHDVAVTLLARGHDPNIEEEDDTMVKLLLDNGAQPNFQDNNSHLTEFPLLWAAKTGHKEVARLLLEAGADPSAKDSFDGDGRTPLSYAAQRGYQNVMEVLLASGKVDADSRDIDGRTPLSYAFDNKVARVLLASSRVNVDSRDEVGRTPLWHAVDDERLDVVQLLLAYGADRESKDNFGQIPLMKAKEGLEAYKKGNKWPDDLRKSQRVLSLLV